MATSKEFYDTLTAAINDMAKNGYDSPERVAYWTEQIRKVAEASMRTSAQMQEMLRQALHAVYRRNVESLGVLKLHPGVSRFTIEKVLPTLRAELDRRILASASLIKLNRQEAMEKTLRRFQGWATSIPIGGSAEPDKAEAKKDIRKSLASLPFTERRVLIDQGRKLGASINATIAQGGGAIAGMWRSNYRQPGYDYREDHKERDGHVYLVRDSWAQQSGLVKPGEAGYIDDVTQPAEEVFCRCRYVYLYNLRQLPEDMLTVKGKAELQKSKVQ
jgi:hypothetical protein